MGVDIYGTVDENRLGARFDEDSDTGRNPGVPYFRNNWWWWRPLWDYLRQIAPGVLTDEEYEAGHANCGPLLDAAKVAALREALATAISDGRVADYAALRAAEQKAEPDIPCIYCGGSGDRKDLGPPEWKAECGGCNCCHGKGVVRPSETLYPFSVENAGEFLEFLKASDGMTIY